MAEDRAASDVALKAYSCLACRQRKIKCGRHAPCSNCAKADTPCSFIPPVRGKRRRTKPVHEGLHAKLKRYEEMLRSYGAKIEPSMETEDSDVESATNQDSLVTKDAKPEVETRTGSLGIDGTKPKLVTKEENSRYFDSPLSINLGDKFHYLDGYTNSEPLHESGGSECELLLTPFDTSAVRFDASNLTSHHPHMQVVQKLKEVYADRVDPLMKILHLPTFWSAVNNAVQYPQDIPKSLEAAIFSFYFVTASALDDDECQSLLKTSKSITLSRYRTVARQALINAGFLTTSSPMTLRAFLLFLMGSRSNYRFDTQYILSGVAVRLARKMGLHRDGESLGLTPFETEMRRRLWWHITHVDFRITDLMGSRPSLDLFFGDTKMPLNVADEDLTPDMVDPPRERTGITPLVHFLVRCEMSEFLRRLILPFSPLSNDLHWDMLTRPDITAAKKDRMIGELEDLLERKYLRYCDLSVPLHMFASIAMRSGICKMKLIAHNPRLFAQRCAKMPPPEREIIFVNATKLLEYAALIHGDRRLKKYSWQVGTTYLWDAVLYVLIETLHRKTGPDVDRAWELMGVPFSQYRDSFKESTGSVYAVLGRWALEVWDSYVAATKAGGSPEPVVPKYIDDIRRCQTPATVSSPSEASTEMQLFNQSRLSSGKSQLGSLEVDQNGQGNLGYNFPDLMSFEIDPNEWIQWEQLISEHSGFGKMDNL